jgi:hypothetical protein
MVYTWGRDYVAGRAGRSATFANPYDCGFWSHRSLSLVARCLSLVGAPAKDAPLVNRLLRLVGPTAAGALVRCCSAHTHDLESAQTAPSVPILLLADFIHIQKPFVAGDSIRFQNYHLFQSTSYLCTRFLMNAAARMRKSDP